MMTGNCFSECQERRRDLCAEDLLLSAAAAAAMLHVPAMSKAETYTD